MKLTRRQLRKTIRGIILQEGMKMPERLPADIVVVINYTKSPELLIHYAKIDENGEIDDEASNFRPMGYVLMSLDTKNLSYGMPSSGPCGNAATVKNTVATKGWGPLLYDVAIEVASSEASGLIADRDSVSLDAWNVWNNYMIRSDGKSNDVDYVQLDDLDNTLTRDWEDNCDQDVASLDKNSYDWTASPLSKMYIKNTTPMMDELDELGKLYKIGSQQ